MKKVMVLVVYHLLTRPKKPFIWCTRIIARESLLNVIVCIHSLGPCKLWIGTRKCIDTMGYGKSC